MRSITTIINKLLLSGAALVLSCFGVFYSAGIAFADGTIAPPPCVAPADTSYGNGVHHPVGADAAAFTYRCSGPYAGKWTSQYYVYDPVTTQRSPLYSPDYSYDCATSTWTMVQWTFNPTTNTYVSSRVVPATAPSLPTGCAPPPVSSTNTAGNNGTISGTGTGSTNSTGNGTSLSGTASNNTTLTMTNALTSLATSGNTAVIGNTTAGSATSGNATAITTVANLLQSTSNVLGPNTVVFSADINGDVNGDVVLDPSAILSTGTSSTNSAGNSLQVNTATANTTDAAIVNNIDTGAVSGNAAVSGNTTAGSATSGNATDVVNLLNIINSTVSAGKSFIGTININGNLNGDILLPQSVIDQLLASTGTGSTNSANVNLADTGTATNTTTQSVTNNILASATSGNASVADNTTAGNATSGNTGTNITLLNLTGSNTIGKNDLLVFVNVLGKWVGMIVDAPAGTTAAELGGGITGSGTDSSNSLSTNTTGNSTVANTTNQSITNNVTASAESGGASVYHNTTAGNATSGNAFAAVNILNMLGSNLSLSNWFGILFINVFGIWNGSFGINTSAGDPAVIAQTQNPVQAATERQAAAAFRQFASFVPHSSGSASGGNSSGTAILGTATSVAKKVTAVNTTPTPDNAPHASYAIPIIGACLAVAILAFSERGRVFKKKG